MGVVSNSTRPTEALIDLAALRANFAEALQHAAGREVIAVVKADAYGHGAVPVARALAGAGCRRFAVVTVSEAVQLRQAGIDEPILVLGGIHGSDEAREVVARLLTPVVHAPDALELLGGVVSRDGRPLPVQVEVDTGMRRLGATAENGDALALMRRVAEEPSVTLAGTFTHLARADEPDLAPCFEQLHSFRTVLREARRAGIAPGEVHVANSAALLVGDELRGALPEAAAVRPGLMLYGARPAPHLAGKLRPVMTLRARVQLVRGLRAGQSVGYAAVFRAERDTQVATLPLGYADGVPVGASNRGCVLIGGRRFPIAGRVSMDSITVDVGDAQVKPGDAAVIFGVGSQGSLPVEEAAEAAGTISYELLVRVGSRVPRVVTA